MTLHFNRRQAAAAAVESTLAWRTAPAAESFDAWCDAFAAGWVRLSAEGATFSQFVSGAEQAAFERELTPNTPAQRDKRSRLARCGLAELARLDKATFTPAQRAGAAARRGSLHRTQVGARCEDHGYAFSQLSGPHLRYVNLLTQAQPLHQVKAFLPPAVVLSDVVRRWAVAA